MRSLGISAISVALTAAIVGNAYYQKKQFYPSVVYITKSNPSMAVIYMQSMVFVLMMGKLMSKIFLGTLRAAEFEHLMERFWYALTETCLAFTVFRDDFNPKFVALFTVLLFLKSFHWLAEERVDYMERSPVIGVLFHIRVSALLIGLGFLDYCMISYAYYATIAKGANVQLVFGFEYAILITMIANIAIKYVLHAAELRSENPWENKAVFLLYTELVIGFLRVVLYVLFVAIMVRVYTLPLFAFRPMYYTMRNFKKALNDVILSRRAIRNMNTLYPDATPEELANSDNICIICREDMANSSKKLPCGHIFHTACLRSWFQRQQTCPTCRLNILRNAHNPSDTRPRLNILNNNNNNNNNNQVNAINANANNINQAANNLNPMPIINSQPNVQLPMGARPFPFNPYQFLPTPAFPLVQPPSMPDELELLSEEELRALERNDRKSIEERIKLLRNIQLLLDSSVALMNQYVIVSGQHKSIPVQKQTTTNSASSNTTAPPNENNLIPSGIEVIQTANQSLAAEAIASTSCSISNESTSVAVSPNNLNEMIKTNTSSDVVAPSTSKESESHVIEKNVARIEDLSNDDIDLAAELRKRRLQKFLDINKAN